MTDKPLSLSELLTEHDEIAALRAENRHLREEIARLDSLIDFGVLAEIERLRAALVKHHELLTDEPDDLCWDCGLAWDGALSSDKAKDV